MSRIGLLQEEKIRKMHGRRVSEETVYSVQTGNGSGGGSYTGSRTNFPQRRPLRSNIDTNSMFKPVPGSSSYVAQRVLSAKVLRVKELQSELQQMKNQLHEVMTENKMLRNLQKRQDTALSRYEDSSAALPRLLENHRAEVSTLKSHAKEVRAAARSLHRKLQRSEAELLNLREQYNKLKQVAEDKNLESRTQLQKRVDELEDRLKEMKEKNITLNKRLEIEQKSHSQQLNSEISKRKNVHKELQIALKEISRLTTMIQRGSFTLKGGDGDATARSNNLISNSLSCTQMGSVPDTSRTAKSNVRKSVPQNVITNKKIISQTNIAVHSSDTQLKHVPKIAEENKDDGTEKEIFCIEEKETVNIPLIIKTSSESIASSTVTARKNSSLLAKNILDGVQIAQGDFELPSNKNECNENNEYAEENEINNDEAANSNESSGNENEKPNENQTEKMYDWYSEEFSENKDSSTAPSRNTSKSSAESYERQFKLKYNSVDKEKFDRNYNSDSSDAEERPVKYEKKPSLASNRDVNYNDLEKSKKSIQETPYRKANPPLAAHSSRYTKTTKNNLIKLQDHMNKFDEDLTSYYEQKASRNSSSDDIQEKGALEKQSNFKDFVRDIQEIDRLNENLITRNDSNNNKSSISSPSNRMFISDVIEKSETSRSYRNEKYSYEYDQDRTKQKHIELKGAIKQQIEMTEIDAESYIEEIDKSYKMIRSKMDEENALMNEKLQQYCKDVASDVQKANDAIDRQKYNLELNRRETEKIERAININTKLNDQLKYTSGRMDSSKKNQLLAALKAIDSGQDVDDLNQLSAEDMPATTTNTLNSSRRMNKKQVMKELFD